MAVDSSALAKVDRGADERRGEDSRKSGESEGRKLHLDGRECSIFNFEVFLRRIF
jgi:hypothetical protein